jgi:bacillithiol biosynthesis cysteine-adding enzyme BshC
VANPASLDLIVTRPSGVRVVEDYLEKVESALVLYGRHFTEAADFATKAAEVDHRFDRAARERAIEGVLVPPGSDEARLERFVEQGGYMVTTGQQPALFGGPMYSLYKAMTAVRLAEALEKTVGRPVLPLFWVASEDHDWDEANHTDVIGVDNELHRVELAAPDPVRHPALHRIELGGGVVGCLERFLTHLPDTDFSGEYEELLRASHRADSTLPAAFHATLQHLMGRFGLYFTDAAHPAVKRHSSGMLLSELDRAEELEAVLGRTSRAVLDAGYDLQVPILDGGVNLFLDGPAGRERLYREGTGFRLRTSGTEVSVEDVRRAVAADPSVLSPNVLLRPVVESALFPTLAYVAGPGEIAYFAQLGAYFRAHDIEMPIVHPRWGATALEAKIQKVLSKFGMEIGALQRPFHEVAGDVARDEVPDDVRSAIGKLRGAVGAAAGDLQKTTKEIDPTLKGPVQQMRGQAFAALDDLEKKILQAVKRENQIALAQLEKAQLHIFPLGKPAERVQSPFYYLMRYGGALLDDLYERFSVNLD